MSDSSGDELAAYDPTTPVRRVAARKPTRRPAHLGNKFAAGPSKPVNATTKNASKRVNGHTKGKQPEHIVIESSSESEPQRDELEDDDEDTVAVAAPPLKAASKKGPGRASDTSATNKPKSSAAKGKARADPPLQARTSRSVIHEDDAMDVDGVQSNEEPSQKRVRSGPPTKPVKTNARSSRTAREQETMARENTRLGQDNEDLRKEIETLKYERDQYSKQVEEVLQIRRTEPEQAFQEHMALYENMMKNQQMWQDLSNAASGSGRSQIPHFLSRDAADAERETTEKEVRRLKDIVKQKDTQLTDKDNRIAELEREIKEVRFELAQEIERANALAARPPAAAPVRTAVKPDNDPKNAAVISIYEDMTNLLITNAKIEKSQNGVDENIFTCVYTHPTSDAGSAGSTSLSFTLREMHERIDGGDRSTPVQSKAELLRKCKYTPQIVEVPEWFERLEFFREPFLFAWDQLTVFLKTLTEKVGAAINPDGEDEDDEEEEEVNKTVEREVITID
ncbi:hypothetical protein DAEQUDRAFT_764002 [Daedalea quercina L-15889]|uniref:Monopolin complex subunit Csm1/Pcs1 C-terminal domain-containing protein n=1 Tax=Daedalea quercina L-15889 TaxID=1314783 RepID=A0A165S1N1_9APHY|nr:hypothetical protein DAEQUDRAFT_764002 [Daedalea quercina L-15889]